MPNEPPTLEDGQLEPQPSPAKKRPRPSLVERFLLSIFLLLLVFTFYAVVLTPKPSRIFDLSRQDTIRELATLNAALDRFHNDTGRYPTTKEGLAALVKAPPGLSSWKGPYVPKVPPDKWDRPFIYLCPGVDEPDSYDLSSAGRDGVPDTDDDILKFTEN